MFPFPIFLEIFSYLPVHFRIKLRLLNKRFSEYYKQNIGYNVETNLLNHDKVIINKKGLILRGAFKKIIAYKKIQNTINCTIESLELKNVIMGGKEVACERYKGPMQLENIRPIFRLHLTSFNNQLIYNYKYLKKLTINTTIKIKSLCFVYFHNLKYLCINSPSEFDEISFPKGLEVLKLKQLSLLGTFSTTLEQLRTLVVNNRRLLIAKNLRKFKTNKYCKKFHNHYPKLKYFIYTGNKIVDVKNMKCLKKIKTNAVVINAPYSLVINKLN